MNAPAPAPAPGGVGVAVGVALGVAVGVALGVEVGVAVGVGVGAARSPKTPTPVVEPAYTFPFAIVGTANLFPEPKESRLLPACVVL